jgi:hypothetical protein
MGWNDGLTRPVTLGELGQRYRHYRLADPDAEEAMAGSLRRWGQLSPVVACVRQGKFELSATALPTRLFGQISGIFAIL